MADGARIFLGLTSCRNVDLRHRNATGRQHHDERHGHDSGSLGKRAAQLEDPAARVCGHGCVSPAISCRGGCAPPQYCDVLPWLPMERPRYGRHRATPQADCVGSGQGGAIVRETVARAFHRPGEGAKCITISSAQGPQSTGRSEVWPVIHRSVKLAPTCWRESVVSGAGR